MKKKERPQRFDDFLGQEEIVDNLSIYIDAAKKRKEVLDHIIISGPSGMGKTTLAGIIANEMGSKITFMHGANFEKQANIISVITAVKKGDIIFIDEIHRINKVVEEILYTALEDYRIDVIVGEGLEKRTINIDIEPFCLIGATTMLGHLSIPLVNRFGIDIIFKPYTEEAVLKLVEYYANQYEVKIEKDAMKLIL
ncbi:MAG: AAA family ATPase [Spiroplasma sp.]|nr:AAA family ATPase [Mycoplasmatales bacterium]